MAAQVECSGCGSYIHHGPVICLECSGKSVVKIRELEEEIVRLRLDLDRLTRGIGQWRSVREMGYHDVEQFYQSAPSNPGFHLTAAPVGLWDAVDDADAAAG